MSIDFYYAVLIGWSFLAVFWFVTIIFIFIRKPPNSKLTLRLTIGSIIIFLIGYLSIFFLGSQFFK